VSRFFLSQAADRDIDNILEYLESAVPRTPRRRIGRDLQIALKSIAANPYLGALQSEFTCLAGTEVRSRLVSSYRIFYTCGPRAPEIIAILHTSRDISSIVASRLQ
jgi:plasmid stabilization system protein ParE